jgi:hypothetical protein
LSTIFSAIASNTIEIHEKDDPRVKELKKLFNERNSEGFTNYWEQSGLDVNFVDTFGRGWMFWFIGVNLLANEGTLQNFDVDVYFGARYAAVQGWDQKDVTG